MSATPTVSKESNALYEFFDMLYFDWDIYEPAFRGFISNASVAVIVASVIAFGLTRSRVRAVPFRFWPTLGNLGVIALFGAMVGYAGGASREGVVGDLIPAVMTLLAGAVTYMLGISERKMGAITFPMVSAFIVTLFFCYILGASSRVGFENSQARKSDKEFTRETCIGVFSDAEILASETALTNAKTLFAPFCKSYLKY